MHLSARVILSTRQRRHSFPSNCLSNQATPSAFKLSALFSGALRWFQLSPAEQERQHAEEQEKQTRASTFEELLKACHKPSLSISVQTDKSLSMQGSTTKAGRMYRGVRDWSDILGSDTEASAY